MKICSVRKAFTLAEVLITLGIIGVVSALVLNPLVVNYQKKINSCIIKESIYGVSSSCSIGEIGIWRHGAMGL